VVPQRVEAEAHAAPIADHRREKTRVPGDLARVDEPVVERRHRPVPRILRKRVLERPLRYAPHRLPHLFGFERDFGRFLLPHLFGFERDFGRFLPLLSGCRVRRLVRAPRQYR